MDRDWPGEGGSPGGPGSLAPERPFEPQPNPEPNPQSNPQPNPWPVHHAAPPGPARAGRERVGVVALVAALIGALVGGGVVALANHHATTTIVAASPGDSSVGARPSTVLAKPGDIRSILAKVEPAVVRIDVTATDAINSQSGTGTGFIVDSSGIIVTNAHVANAETATAARQLVVTLADGDSVRGRVLGEDTTQDIAVIKIDRTGLPTVQLGNSDSLQVGDAVVAIGNALGIAGSPTVTTGIVSGLGRTVGIAGTETLVDAIQTDAAINPGNSGGPLVDINGRVIGMNTAIADPGSANNVGFAISISSAKPVIDALRAGRKPQIAFMGVQTETVTPSLVAQAHLVAKVGAYVALVSAGQGAARAGVRRGDVMIVVDGRRVTSNNDVLRIVREHRPGDKLSVIVQRGSAQKTLVVTLGRLRSG
jgi:S1-C subfamily serine protease